MNFLGQVSDIQSIGLPSSNNSSSFFKTGRNKKAKNKKLVKTALNMAKQLSVRTWVN